VKRKISRALLRVSGPGGAMGKSGLSARAAATKSLKGPRCL
jgi:hypothetical protein